MGDSWGGDKADEHFCCVSVRSHTPIEHSHNKRAKDIHCADFRSFLAVFSPSFLYLTQGFNKNHYGLT